MFDNSTSDSSSFDIDLLKLDFNIDELNNLGITLNDDELDFIPDDRYGDTEEGALSRRYLVAPYSVLRADMGDWAERKRKWINKGLRSEEGRGWF